MLQRHILARIAVTVSIPLVVLTVAVGAGVVGLWRTVTSFEAATSEAVDEVLPLTALQNEISSRESYDLLVQVVTDPEPETLAAHERAVARTRRSFEAVMADVEKSEGRSAIGAAQREWEASLAVVEVVRRAPSDQLSQVGTAQKPRYDRLIGSAAANLERAEGYAVDDLREELAAARSTRQRVVVAVGAIWMAALLIASAVTRHLERSLTRPLAHLVVGARHLGGGELSHRVALARNDELGEVADAFNGMAVELQRSHAELRHQALHDPLTGLANRTLLDDRIAHALSAAQRRGEVIALLLIDIDEFKQVNDSHGHAVGDQALVAVAERLSTGMRQSDTLARLGGDEFAVLVEGVTDPEQLLGLAERVHASLRSPLDAEGHILHLAVSIGVAVSGSYPADDPEGLLRGADLAMYRAKQAGKDRTQRFEPAMFDETVTRLRLESDLRHAVEADQLVLHYQPIVDLESGSVLGVEALVRWRHPERGLIPPAAFIPIAEKTGLITTIGSWVLETACAQVRRWELDRPLRPRLQLAVNLSAVQLEDPALLRRIDSAVAASGFDPERLSLEITESVALGDTDGIAVLAELKELGVKLALDDFGTGYSSLGRLRQFPLDCLKIDKSFVDRVHLDDEARSLIRAIVTMCDSLRLDTVAEGVEEPEQAQVLHTLGCRAAQGYYFARPLPPEEMGRILDGDRVPLPAPTTRPHPSDRDRSPVLVPPRA